MDEKVSIGINKYLNLEGNLCDIASELNISSKILNKELYNLGYFIRGGVTAKQVIAIKEAVDYYQQHVQEQVSISKVAKMFHCSRSSLTARLKNLGYNIINYQKLVKFDEHVFDSIDTEEKAYWLGFIFADGYISDDGKFELSLKDSDSEHLEKFNVFMKCNTINKIKHSTTKCDNKIYQRCR